MKLIECKDKPDWLVARLKDSEGLPRFTASDVAAAMGVAPWKSRLALYAEKIGEMPSDIEESEPMSWGRVLQGGIGRRFAEKTGRQVEEAPPFTLIVSDDEDWLACTPDFYENDKEKGDGVLEIKATSHPWLEDAPAHYQVQLQVQLHVTKRKYGTLCAFNGLKNPPAWIDYDKHDAFIKRMLGVLDEFRWRVIHRKPPEPNGQAEESTREALAALYPRDSGARIELPAEALEWTQELEQFKAQQKAISEQILLRENRIKAVINEATYGVLPDGSLWSWKEQVRIDPPRLEPRETRFRVLRRVKGER